MIRPSLKSNGHSVVLFVEAEKWEHDWLVQNCRAGCRVHSRAQRLEELSEADIPPGVNVLSTFINSHVVAEQLDRLGELELVATRSTGFDHIDLQACRQRGVVVSNVPDYGEITVAEHTFALLLSLTRKIHRCYERTIRGDFSIEGLRGQELAGKTLGVLGTGKIGQRVLRIAKGFGMRLLAHDVSPRPQLAKRIGFKYVTLEELLRRSDVLSIHVPYGERTRHMIDAEAIAKLPAGAIIVNTARGGIIDPQALIEALVSGHLGGAALDVLEAEMAIAEEAELLSSSYDMETLRTVVRNHALLRMPNVIITPHVGFNSAEAVRRIIDTTLDNIRSFLRGAPKNVVSQPAPVG